MKPLTEMSPDEKTETVARLWTEIREAVVAAEASMPSFEDIKNNLHGEGLRAVGRIEAMVLDLLNNPTPTGGEDYCPTCGEIYEEFDQYGPDAKVCAACHDKGIRESPIIVGLFELWTRVSNTETEWGYLAEEIPIPAIMFEGRTDLPGIPACRSHRLVAYLCERWFTADYDEPLELTPDIRVYCYTCKEQFM